MRDTLIKRQTVVDGARSDLDGMDLDRHWICAPMVRADLLAGQSRVLQPAEGHVAAIVHGTAMRRDGAGTGMRPGALVRGGA